MKAIICGANGAMGKLICDILGEEVVGKVSIDGLNGVPTSFEALGKMDADVVVDFSHHTAIESVLRYAKAIGAADVVGSIETGKQADFIVTSADYATKRVFIAGKEI